MSLLPLESVQPFLSVLLCLVQFRSQIAEWHRKRFIAEKHIDLRLLAELGDEAASDMPRLAAVFIAFEFAYEDGELFPGCYGPSERGPPAPPEAEEIRRKIPSYTDEGSCENALYYS